MSKLSFDKSSSSPQQLSGYDNQFSKLCPENQEQKSNFNSSTKNFNNSLKSETNTNNYSSPFLKSSPLSQSANKYILSPQTNASQTIEDDSLKSKAVLSALRSLQEKIQKLQEENVLLRDCVENEKFLKEKQKQDFETQVALTKIEFMKEKESIIGERETINTELRLAKEKLNTIEKEAENYKTILGTQDLDKKSYAFQTQTLSEQLKSTETTIEERNKSIVELQGRIERDQAKIEELEIKILKERKKRSKMDSEKKVIEQAFKEIVQVHQSVMEHKVEVVLKKKPKEPKRILSSLPRSKTPTKKAK